MFEPIWCCSDKRRFPSAGVQLIRNVLVVVGFWIVISGDRQIAAQVIDDKMLNMQTLGLPEIDLQPNFDEVVLGARLFFDQRLSIDATVACSTCHVPEQGFTQNLRAVPLGVFGRVGRRNPPALFNLAFATQLFVDGRESSLFKQVWSPVLAAHEMGHITRETFITHLQQLPGYTKQFAAVYEQGLTQDTFAQALVAYQKILFSGNSPFDQWYFGGQMDAVTEEVKRGFALFVETGCSRCHQLGARDVFFSDGKFHNTGVALLQLERSGVQDLGREEVTGAFVDRRKFRTPSLRNVALTAPYMHDGSLASLTDVLQFYVAGGGRDPNRDPALQPIDLSARELSALLAFLHSLTSSNVAELVAQSRQLREQQIQ